VLYVIKRLLRQERYTVAGAKELLRQQTIADLADVAHENFDVDAEQPLDAGTPVMSDAEREAKAIADELAAIAATLRDAAAKM
jgi:hypothetical protein